MLLVLLLAVAVLPPLLACHVEDEVYDFYANQVRCDEVKVPDNCELTNIFIKQKLYQDVRDNSLEISTLGQKVAFPIGISPTATQEFAEPTGEMSTAAGDDAVKSIRAGASAVFVSNTGGRELDGLPATIDVLPGIVKDVKKRYPKVDVYVDGGIRNGFDVYKAIAAGAKMVFVGRPVVWVLTLDGQKGVETVLSILKTEFNNTTISAGKANPQQISGQDTSSPLVPVNPILPLF